MSKSNTVHSAHFMLTSSPKCHRLILFYNESGYNEWGSQRHFDDKKFKEYRKINVIIVRTIGCSRDWLARVLFINVFVQKPLEYQLNGSLSLSLFYL